MATRLKEVIQDFLKKKRRDLLKHDKIKKAVEKTLGEEVSKHIVLKGICDNKLVLGVDSSLVHYQINLSKDSILGRVKKITKEIDGLVVELGDEKNG